MTPRERLLEEAAHLARATVRQSYLVRQEAELIEAALFENQDDPNAHHVRPGQTTPIMITLGLGDDFSWADTTNVIPFKRRAR
jgi:hypothetical protein